MVVLLLGLWLLLGCDNLCVFPTNVYIALKNKPQLDTLIFYTLIVAETLDLTNLSSCITRSMKNIKSGKFSEKIGIFCVFWGAGDAWFNR